MDYEQKRERDNHKHNLPDNKLEPLNEIQTIIKTTLRLLEFTPDEDRTGKFITYISTAIRVPDNDVMIGLREFYRNSSYNPLHYIFNATSV